MSLFDNLKNTVKEMLKLKKSSSRQLSVKVDIKLLITHIQRSHFVFAVAMFALLMFVTSADGVGPGEQSVNKFNKLISAKSPSWLDVLIKEKSESYKKTGGYLIVQGLFSVDNPIGQVLQPSLIEDQLKECDLDVENLLRDDGPDLFGCGPRKILPLDSSPSDIKKIFQWNNDLPREEVLKKLKVADWEKYWKFLSGINDFEIITDVDEILVPDSAGSVRVFDGRKSAAESVFRIEPPALQTRTDYGNFTPDSLGRLWLLSSSEFEMSGAKIDDKKHRWIYASPLSTKAGIDFSKGVIFECEYVSVKIDFLSALFNGQVADANKSFYGLFPDLKQYDELNKPVSDIDFEKERKEQRDKRNLKLFVDLEGQQIWSWGPLILIVIYVYILAHINFLAGTLKFRRYKDDLPPVSLFYPGIFYMVFSLVSIAVAPWSVFEYFIFKEYGTSSAAFWILTSLFSSIVAWMWKSVLLVRERIKSHR